jgi:hypothetical protein
MNQKKWADQRFAVVILGAVWLLGCAGASQVRPSPSSSAADPPSVSAAAPSPGSSAAPPTGNSPTIPADREERMPGSELLLPGQTESTRPKPYGLYSYLLFGSAPTEAAGSRHLAAVRSYLKRLPTVRKLERDGAPRRRLNATYLPVQDRRAVQAIQSSDPQAAEIVLRHYNYAFATTLLNKLPHGPHLEGPYLVSCHEPASSAPRLPSSCGWVDLSTVPPHGVDGWLRIFLKETAPRNYGEPLMLMRVWGAMLNALHHRGDGATAVLEVQEGIPQISRLGEQSKSGN